MKLLGDGRFRLDPHKRCLWDGKQRVHLEPLTYKVLEYLVRNRGRLIPFDELIQKVWPAQVEAAAVRNQIAALRAKLGDAALEPTFIKNYPREGYEWIAPVSNFGRRKRALLLTGIVLMAIAGWFTFRNSPPALETLPLTADPGVESDPELSVDGSRVLYVSAAGITTRTVRGGAPPSRLTGPGAHWAPRRSPDGKWVAFVRGTKRDIRELVVTPWEGGPENVLGEMQGLSVSWATDSKHLAIIDLEPPSIARKQPVLAVFLVSLETKERRQLTFPPENFWGDIACAFSPDGKKLAVARYPLRDSAGDLYLMKGDGSSPRRITKHECWILGLAWTPDGRHLVYHAQDRWKGRFFQGLWQIRTSWPYVGSPIFGTNGLSLRPTVSWSPDSDGMRIAYQADSWKSNIWRWDSGTSRAATIASSTHTDEAPAITRSGKRLAFVSNRSGAYEVWISGPDGSNPRQLTNLGASLLQQMRWSPDERRLSFVARFAGGRFIYVLDVDSGRNETPRRLTKTDARFDEGTPSWSSNGRSIYFRSGRSGSPQIWKAPVEGGEASQITQGGGLEGIESPDGKLLYFLRGPEAPGLWSIPADGGVESRMPTLSMVSAGLWDVAERGVVFVDVDPRQEITTQPSFRMYEFATGNIVTIGAAPRARELFSGFSVTRDVSTIYWNQTEEGGSDLRWSDHFGQPNRWVSIVWVLAGAALALAIWKSIPPRARKDRL